MTKIITRVDSLTEEQRAMFPVWVKKWIEIGLRTGETDWDTFEKYIRVAYEKAKIPFPNKIIRVQSPIVGAFASSIADNIINKNKGAMGVAVENAVENAVGGAVRGAVRDAVEGAVGDAVEGAVGNAVGGAVGDAVDNAVEGAVRSAVRGAVRSKKIAWHYWLGGQMWVGYWYGSPSTTSFFFEVCNLKLSDDIMERAEAYRKICESVNYIWCNKDFVMVCARPSHIDRNAQGRLHSDKRMSIMYPDDYQFKQDMKRTQIEKGMRWGRLSAIRFSEIKNGQSYWYFKCDCGKEKVINLANVRHHKQLSCGCLGNELRIERNIKHGYAKNKERIYRIWSGMKNRCLNVNNKDFHLYGGRGIELSIEWQNFENFLKDMEISFKEHSKIHGDIDTTIDRIDNDGNYCKENCRWATQKEQANNRRVKDGWGLYHLNGVRFEKELWEKVVSGKMPYEDILKIVDVDQRAQALKYGDWTKFTEWQEAKKIDDFTKYDINGETVQYELWLFPLQDKEDKKIFNKEVHFARYLCPSTREWKVKGVPAFKTVAEAMSWGMSDEEKIMTPDMWKSLVPLVHES